MDTKIDISGIDKAELTAFLYNRSKPVGYGELVAGSGTMRTAEAKEIITANGGDASFNYLKGRVMKVDLNGSSFDPSGYDRDNGEGAANKVVEELRATSGPPKPQLGFGLQTFTLHK